MHPANDVPHNKKKDLPGKEGAKDLMCVSSVCSVFVLARCQHSTYQCDILHCDLKKTQCISHTHTQALSSSLFPQLYVSNARSVRLTLLFHMSSARSHPSLPRPSLPPFLRVSLSHRLFKLRLVNIQTADLCLACFLVRTSLVQTQIKAQLNSIQVNSIAASQE